MKNFIYFTAPNVISAIAFFLFLFPLMTNYITLDDFGIRAIIHLSLIPFEVITAFGASWIIQAYFLDFSNRNDRGSFLFTLFVYGSVIRVTFFILFYFFLHKFFHYILPWSDDFIIFFYLSLFARLLRSHDIMILEICTMDKQSSWFFIYRISILFVTFISTFYYLAVEKIGLLGLFYADILGSAVSFLFIFLFGFKYFNLSIRQSHLKSIIKVGYPAIPRSFLGTLSKNTTSYFITIFAPIGVLGVYNRSTMLSPYYQFMWQSLRRTVSPDYITHSKNGKDYFSTEITNSWLIISSLFLIFICFFYSDFLIFLKVDEEYLIISYYTPLLLIRNSIDGANLFPSLHIILNKRIDLDLYVQIIRFFLLATSSFFLIPKYELMGGIISIIFAYFMAYILKYFVAKKIKYKGSISIFFMFTMFFSVLISHHISFSLDFDFFPKIILFFFIIIGFSFLDTSFNNSFLRHGIAASTRSLKINR